MDARRRRRRRRGLLAGAIALLTGPPSALIAVAIVVAGAGACTAGGGVLADAASPAAQSQIPSQWLQIFQQVGAQYRIPWEILAGIAKNECDFAQNRDPSCTPQPGATGPGTGNPAGASGPMQIGVGGTAGNEYQTLQQYLPNPHLGPHDPTTAVQLAALVLIKHKGAPQGAPIDAYLPYVTTYNGTGLQADAYGQQVIADAHAYQGNTTTTTTTVSTGCAAQAATSGYANPLANAPHVIPERIDMGVDYANPQPEPIDAIGAGTITYAGPQAGGWQPNCINYTLDQPPTPTQQYVYVCEHITPTVQTGQTVQPGQQIGTFIPGGGLETGFADAPGNPVSTRAAALSQQAQTGDAGDNRTYCGQAMSDLIQQAGGPPGLTEGRTIAGSQC